MRRALAITAVVAGAFLVGTWWAMPGGDPARDTAAPSPVAARSGPATAARTSTSVPQLVPRGPDRMSRADARPRPPESETVDPCTAIEDPEIPPGYEQTTADGITIAWSRATPPGPADRPLRPLVLARLVSALLEEAADATGTTARTSLVVIVYPSRDDFRAGAHAPAWSAGLYDGGVELPASAMADLGVDMETLRHEVMHAQLHLAVGCMPVWFNEGVAMLFAGETPVRSLLRLVREHEPVDVGGFGVSTVDAIPGGHTSTTYAQFLAMTLVVLDTIDLKQVVPAMSALSPAQRMSSWHHFSELDGNAMLDAFAQRVFGTRDVAPLLAAPLCCSGLHAPHDLSCHAAPPRDGDAGSDRFWIDKSQAPFSMCAARW